MRYLLFILALSLSAPAYAAPTELAERIRSAVEAERVKDKVSALSYAVFNGEKIVADGHLGSASDASLFRLASISKVFTTLAISQLIEAKVVSLDTPILQLNRVKFVQHLKRHETAERLRQWGKVTIRHLMTHRAGFSKDVPGVLVFFNTESLLNNSYPSDQEFYRGLTKVEFLFAAGEVDFKYSNLAMNMLARVVEAYNPDRLKFSAYVAKRILAPLGMRDTHYDLVGRQQKLLVDGFGALQADGNRTSVPKAYRVGSYDGSIGVACTAKDLGRFGMELLGLFGDAPKLVKDPAVIRNFFTLAARASPTRGWASGPFWQTLPGEQIASSLWVGHSGTGAGERSVVLVSPEKNLGVAVVFNTIDVNREKYVKIIAEVVESAKPPAVAPSPLAIEILAQARDFLGATPEPKFVTPKKHEPTSDLVKFVGSYYADIPGVQKITLSSDGYLMFFGQKLAVENVKQGRFRFPPIPGPDGVLFSAEPVSAEFDAAGNPVGLRVANVKKFRKIE